MIKDVAIHLTGSGEDAIRMAQAAAIAAEFDAHLSGLLVHEIPEFVVASHPAAAAVVDSLVAESLERAEINTARLTEQFASFGLSYSLRRLDVHAGQAGNALAGEVRLSDLFVGTRPYGDPARKHHVEEQVLYNSGRPCMFMPPSHPARSKFDSVLIAWKNTRETARAVAGSMPFLQKAGSVAVAIVEEGTASEQFGVRSAGDIGTYLSRHGVSAEIRTISGWTDVDAALMSESQSLGSDLLVMGAYGHSRFREWILGGTTRHMLSYAPVPVLVAH